MSAARAKKQLIAEQVSTNPVGCRLTSRKNKLQIAVYMYVCMYVCMYIYIYARLCDLSDVPESFVVIGNHGTCLYSHKNCLNLKRVICMTVISANVVNYGSLKYCGNAVQIAVAKQ